MAHASIDAYHDDLGATDREICDLLRAELDAGLSGAEAKVWHGHPVWFLAGNPIAGYDKLKSCVRLLFWSGQWFNAPGLSPEGKFKAAEARYIDADEIDTELLKSWLTEARTTQWDYKNIVKRKGELVRLT